MKRAELFRLTGVCDQQRGRCLFYKHVRPPRALRTAASKNPVKTQRPPHFSNRLEVCSLGVSALLQ